MSRSHATVLDDESNRGLRRVVKCSRGEDDNLTFVVGEGVGEEKFPSFCPLFPTVGHSRQLRSVLKMADLCSKHNFNSKTHHVNIIN